MVPWLSNAFFGKVLDHRIADLEGTPGHLVQPIAMQESQLDLDQLGVSVSLVNLPGTCTTNHSDSILPGFKLIGSHPAHHCTQAMVLIMHSLS